MSTAPPQSIHVTLTSITPSNTIYTHPFQITTPISAIQLFVTHQLKISIQQCNIFYNGLLLEYTMTLAELCKQYNIDRNQPIQLQYHTSNDISSNSSTLPSLTTYTSASTTQLPIFTNNDSTSILQYYTQLQLYYPLHYNTLLTQYPYIQQQLIDLRNVTNNNTNTTNNNNNAQPLNVQANNNVNNPVLQHPAAAPNNNNLHAIFNFTNLWRFLHIQLIIKISILLFLFCQNGDIYRTVLMCIVAAIAYLYQVGVFGAHHLPIQLQNMMNDNIDEDGFEIIPDHVRQQGEQEENMRRQRAEGIISNNNDQHTTSSDSSNDSLQPVNTDNQLLINMEKFIVGLIASLWPEWQPQVLIPAQQQ